MLLKLNPHGHIAEDPRQANLRITLTPMTVVCRPAVLLRRGGRVAAVSWRGREVPDSLGGTSELVLVDDGSSGRTWRSSRRRSWRIPAYCQVRSF